MRISFSKTVSSLSIAATLSLALFCAAMARQQISIDAFWPGLADIYRMEEVKSDGDGRPVGLRSGANLPITPPSLKRLIDGKFDTAEISTTIIADSETMGFSLGEDNYRDAVFARTYFTDANFLSVFELTLIAERAGWRDSGAYQVFISDTLADALFPDGGAVGTEIFGNDTNIYIIAGVFEAIMGRSTLAFDAFIFKRGVIPGTRTETFYRAHPDDPSETQKVTRTTNSSSTYIRLRALDKGVFDAFLDGVNETSEEHFTTFPFRKIYLHGQAMYGAGGSYAMFLSFCILAAILFIVSMGAISISERLFHRQAKHQIAIVKSFGGHPGNALSLIVRDVGLRAFLIGFFILSIFASCIALLYIVGSNTIDAENITVETTFDLFRYSDIALIFALVAITLIILSPAERFLAVYCRPQSLLKITSGRSIRVGKIELGMLALQFGIGALLALMATQTMRQAIEARPGNLGYTMENIISMRADPGFRSNQAARQTIRDEVHMVGELLQRDGMVAGVAATSFPITLPVTAWADVKTQMGVAETHRVAYESVSPEFFGMFDIPLLAGRGFDRARRRDIFNSKTDMRAEIPVILSLTAAQNLFGPDYGRAIGKTIIPPYNMQATVIGIVADIFPEGKYVKAKPIVYVADTGRLSQIYLQSTHSANDLKRAARDKVSEETARSIAASSLKDSYKQVMASYIFTIMALIILCGMSLLSTTASSLYLCMIIFDNKRSEYGILRAFGHSRGQVRTRILLQYALPAIVMIILFSAFYIYAIGTQSFIFGGTLDTDSLTTGLHILCATAVSGLAVLSVIMALQATQSKTIMENLNAPAG